MSSGNQYTFRDFLGSRPLSPHLTVYKFNVTMVASILPRVAGVYLYFAFVSLLLWMVSSMHSNLSLTEFTRSVTFFVTNSPTCIWVSSLFLFSVLLSFFLFFGAQVRHLFWDFGIGFRVKTARITAWILLASSFLASIVSTYAIIKLIIEASAS